MSNYCSVGKKTQTSSLCCDTNEFISIHDLRTEEKEVLALRIQVLQDELINICNFHKYRYLDHYRFFFGQHCCDPFQSHKKRQISKTLREVSVEMCKKFLHVSALAPGKKICFTCRSKLEKGALESAVNSEDISSEPSSDIDEPCSSTTTLKEKLNASINQLQADMSPIKLHGLNKKSKYSYKKRKLSVISTNYNKTLCKVLNLPESDDDEKEKNYPKDEECIKMRQ